MTAPLIFLDTETCGLNPQDPIWELALIRREPDGNDTEHHWFVQHPTHLAENLPEPFRADHDDRYDPATAKDWDWLKPVLQHLFRPDRDGAKAHLVGAVPNFDAEHIAWEIGNPGWHHHLIDVETLAVGYLAGHLTADRAHGLNPQRKPTTAPWDSDDLSRRIDIDTARYARHQALDDARWARDIYDAVMGR